MPNRSEFIRLSIRNAAQCKGQLCGCYSCLEVFEEFEIEEATDRGQTVICPYCGIDSVVPGVTDKKLFQQAQRVFF